MINLMQPDLGDAELLRIKEVFESNWLGRGSVVTDFEFKFAENLKTPQENFYAMSCCTEGLFWLQRFLVFLKMMKLLSLQ